MTAIKTMLRATILTGAIAFLPSLAGADTTQPSDADPTDVVPDHAQAEVGAKPIATTSSVPDHAQAEARGVGDEVTSNPTDRIPDHAEAEEPGAGQK
jgi:hypothetical protein